MTTLREQINELCWRYERRDDYSFDALVDDVARKALEAAKAKAEYDGGAVTHAVSVSEIDALLEELKDEDAT